MTEPIALPPGSTIGILGGGQLGRMLATAAAQLGFDVHIYVDEADSPAARVAASVTVAPFDDDAALRQFSNACDVVTYEWENIPVSTVELIVDAGTPVFPDPRTLKITQDRLAEKRFLNETGIETTAFWQVDTKAELQAALDAAGGAGILKRRRDGYDGKGQARLNGAGSDLDDIWDRLGTAPCILEALAPFDAELSVVLARDGQGEIAAYEPSRNVHEGGILRRCEIPGGFDDGMLETARSLACRAADAMAYRGILAIEFFAMPDGRLLANEMAPRVHNSGHWTPELCVTGQFEQHIRAIAGWPLGAVDRLHAGSMVNLLGEDIDKWTQLAHEDVSLTIYGKRETMPLRKLGHYVRRARKRL